jgi:hypothetical protein
MSPRPAASRMTRADSGDNGLGCKTGTQRRREICWIMINYSNFAGSSISAAIDCARRLDAFESLLLRRWLYLISWLYLIRPCTEFSSVGLAKPSTANMRGKARRFVAGMAASSETPDRGIFEIPSKHAYGTISNYLKTVGILLSEWHFAEAKQAARNFEAAFASLLRKPIP